MCGASHWECHLQRDGNTAAVNASRAKRPYIETTPTSPGSSSGVNKSKRECCAIEDGQDQFVSVHQSHTYQWAAIGFANCNRHAAGVPGDVAFVYIREDFGTVCQGRASHPQPWESQ